MSPEPAPVPYRQIVTELAPLCRARRTGTLFIATTDNQSARIGLREGEISSLAFRNQRGLEALIHLRKIVAARINFTDTVMDRGPRGDLPMTVDLLDMLDTNDPLAVLPTHFDPGPALAGATGPPPPAPPAGAQLARVQAVIEAELTEYLGPMAAVILRAHIARAGAASPPHDLRQIVGEGLVAETVRLLGRGAESLLAIGFVVLVVALEPFRVAVPFERQHVGGDPVEEPAVVADDDGATREAEQRVLE